ncbi:MAG: hypothetical protein M3X11_15535 [Acidobacteriota bacterium]|nr:hypothetical protein [Acidobacteriota bacterium]
MSEENINSQNSQAAPSWEERIQTRANEFINQSVGQRIGSLKTEIERLQSTINEINSKLTEHSQTEVTEQESSGLLDTIKQWFSDSNDKAEQQFQSRLAEARSDLETSLQQSQEAEFRKRLEQACSEAAAVARREANTQIEELREQLEASREALTIAVSSAQSAGAQASSSDHLKSAIEEIDAQRTQSDTLITLVRRAAQFAPRVVFFVVKGGDAVGWKAAGFENGLNDETVRLLSVPTQNQTLLREALTTFSAAVGHSSSPGDNSSVLGLYGSPAPEKSVTVPLVVRGKAAAVLYADSGTQSENAINTSALEALLRVASMGIELLPARRGVEPVRPSGPPAQLSSSASSATPAASAPLRMPAEIAKPQPTVAPAPEEAATPEAQPDEVPPGVTQDPQDDFADSAAPEEAVVPDRVTEDLSATAVAQEEEPASRPTLFEPKPEPVAQAPTEVPVVALSREEVPVQLATPPPPPAPPAFITPPPQNDVMPPKVEPSVIPPPIRPVEPSFAPPVLAPPAQPAFTAPVAESSRPAQPLMAVPAPTSETEQRAHNDARRFARLLVSEIKLYNAAKVNEGRRSFDLYDRLKDEVDRSRKVYDKRVSPAVATRFDYFYDELVQTLAEGDTNKLGSNCPGPIVLGS